MNGCVTSLPFQLHPVNHVQNSFQLGCRYFLAVNLSWLGKSVYMICYQKKTILKSMCDCCCYSLQEFPTASLSQKRFNNIGLIKFIINATQKRQIRTSSFPLSLAFITVTRLPNEDIVYHLRVRVCARPCYMQLFMNEYTVLRASIIYAICRPWVLNAVYSVYNNYIHSVGSGACACLMLQKIKKRTCVL